MLSLRMDVIIPGFYPNKGLLKYCIIDLKDRIAIIIYLIYEKYNVLYSFISFANISTNEIFTTIND